MSGDVCVVFYSRTGNTRRIAADIASLVASADVKVIRPRRERSYLGWLVLSLVPLSRVPIRPLRTDLRDYDAVFLGAPKWSFSCPPVTEFLSQTTVADTTVGPFVTYGGFDERRYTRRLADRLRKMGAEVPATLRVNRAALGSRGYRAGVERFCDLVLGDG